MLKILVTGANGQLGREIFEISKNYDYEFKFCTKTELDISNFEILEAEILKFKPNLIINAAAYTNVDMAENERETALLINHEAVKKIAEICTKNEIKFFHISTDYVFNGRNFKPYAENDKTDPINFYGYSKNLGEIEILKQNLKNSMIIRTSWLYSKFGKNFVKTMLNLAKTKEQISVVSDQIGSPTNAADLAKFLLDFANFQSEKTDIFHFSNEGVCSWYDFAKEIFDLMEAKIEILPILSENFKTTAKRPHFSVLDKSKIKNHFNIEISNYKDSLKKALLEIKL